jgi:hypothetical protein
MSAMRERRSQHWSSDDDNLLRAMAEAGKSLTLMAVKLDRPMTSIKARAQDLKIHIPGTEIGERSKRRRG